MELKVYDYNLPECVLFNYSELKQELQEKVAMYETLVYTDDQIKQAKADKANLNKLKKALNDERIRREREYMEPFNDFKVKINEIISIIDKPVALIDKQVKEFEEKQKKEKLDKIDEYMVQVEMLLPANVHIPIDSKWLNASVSMKSIKETIDSKAEQIKKDLATLAELPEFGFEAQEVYKDTLDVNKAINEAKRMSEIAKAKAEAEELKKQEELKKEVKNEEVVEPATQIVEEQQKIPYEKPVEKQWVNFSALLSTEDALALKNFFETRNIHFKSSGLTEQELYLVSKVFQNYYCMGIDEIAKDDETAKTLFKKIGM